MKRKKPKMHYVRFDVEKRCPTRFEKFALHHNHVQHETWEGLGLYGFRAWFCEKPLPGFVLCPCGWGPRLGKHYAAREHVKWVKSNNNSGIDATCRRNRALAWEEVTGSV